MTPVSIRNLESLPKTVELKRLLQSLATLELIISPNDPSSRYYSFNSQWSSNVQVGLMNNGMGDTFVALFKNLSCFIKGFSHESPMSPYRVDPPHIWSGMYENVPVEFIQMLDEPAFAMEDVTFCVWRRDSDLAWSHSQIEEYDDEDDPEGSELLFELLDGRPSGCKKFFSEYYEMDVPLDAIQHVYKHRPLTNHILQSLNPDVTLEAIQEAVGKIGYPHKR